MSSASTPPPSRPAAPPAAPAPPGAASRTRVLAWALWDWGTQPWNTVVTTFVFSVYLVGPSFGSANHTAYVQSVCMTVASVAIALIAPVLGQNTDRTGRTMSTLRVLTWAVALINAALFLIADEPAYLWAGFVMLGLGTVASEVAGSVYNGVLDRVSTPRNVGRVSGLGWGMGYLGGIVALMIIYVGFIAPDVGLFGVTAEHGMAVRTAMLLCGAWTLVFTIPTFLVLRDDPAPRGSRLGVLDSYRALLATIVRLWRHDRRVVWFLLASALFRDGLTGIFTYGGALARNTFGFSAGQVVVFGAAANVIAGVATICSGRLDDRVGPRAVIVGSLVMLVALATTVFVLHSGGSTVFWVLGLALCVFVGPAQAASRSYLARIIPPGSSGEIFGLYATTGRVASPLAPLMFGLCVGLGARLTGAENTQYFGIVGIAVVLAAGLLVLLAKVPKVTAGAARD
ncbi:MAG: MFS transporter [Propionibacteriaceae bacterium]|nr:MFS transporter [Propionibacteriaceae bacterium]